MLPDNPLCQVCGSPLESEFGLCLDCVDRTENNLAYLLERHAITQAFNHINVLNKPKQWNQDDSLIIRPTDIKRGLF